MMTRMKITLFSVSLIGLAAIARFAMAQPANALTPVPQTSVDMLTGPVSHVGFPGSAFSAVQNMASGPDGSRFKIKNVSKMVVEQHLEPITPEDLEQVKACEIAMQALKDAKDDDAKRKSSDEIRSLIKKQFEQDLIQREKELATVEQKVKSLRQQLEKRKTAQDEIILLRLKTIINNAEGLGFPGEIDPQATFGQPTAFGLPTSPVTSPLYRPQDAPSGLSRGQLSDDVVPQRTYDTSGKQ